jgi:hypothetical protein
VVLEYLDHLKNGIEVPEVTEQDRRIGLLKEFSEQDAWDKEDGEEMGPGKATAKSLQPFLKQQTKAQLIALIEDLAGRYPVVRETLEVNTISQEEQ